MKFFTNTLLFLTLILFTACSQKKEISINKQITSISLDENIYIANTPRTVKSPVSINLGLGSYSKHVGIHVGTSVRPDISNDDGVNLKKGIELHNISLENLIKTEFKRQMSNHPIYRYSYVPFGAEHKVQLSVSKYEFDDSLFSMKTHIKVYMQLKVVDGNGSIIYEDKEVNTIDSSNVQYTQAEVIRDGSVLRKTLNESIANVIAKLLLEMKKQ